MTDEELNARFAEMANAVSRLAASPGAKKRSFRWNVEAIIKHYTDQAAAHTFAKPQQKLFQQSRRQSRQGKRLVR